MNYVIAALSVSLLLVGWPALCDDRKDHVRLQYTEFCAVVKPPPKALVEAVESSFKNDPTTWAETMAWLSRLGNDYQKRKCGDA